MLTSKFDEQRFNRALEEYRAAESPQTERAALHRCIVAAEPLLQIAMVGIHARNYDELDELQQAGRRAFWRAIEYNAPVDLRPGYLVNAARWRMRDWLGSKAARCEQISFGWLCMRPEEMRGRFEGVREVEDRIFLEQMREIALDRFEERCRFARADYQVCVRIAEAMVYEEEISKRLLEIDHGDVDVKFLKSYVLVCLRNILYDVWKKYREIPAAKWIDDLFAETTIYVIR